HPDFGSVASKLRDRGKDAMPRYVAIPRRTYMTRPVYLGVQHAAIAIPDPSAPSSRSVPFMRRDDGSQLASRPRLPHELGRLRQETEASGRLAAMDRFQERAFDLLTSPRVAEAFDLSRESDRLHDRYGRHLWGQACLLARRLAVAGAAVISL